MVHSISKSTCFHGLPILLLDLNPGGSSSLAGFKIPPSSYLFLVKEGAIVTLALLTDTSIGVDWSMVVHRKVGKMQTYFIILDEADVSLSDILCFGLI